MLFEEVGRKIEAGLAFCFFAHFFDGGRSDNRGFVAEGVSNKGEDGGDFLVGEVFKWSHGDDAGVFCAFDFDGAVKTMESEFDETFFASGNPFAGGDG